MLSGERFPDRGDLPAIALWGVQWFGLHNVVLNAAERLVDAGTAAIRVGVGPVLIALFAGILLGEGFPHARFADCAVAFTRVVVIGLATSQLGLDAGMGAVLCLVAALAYAGRCDREAPAEARLGFAGDVACLQRRSDLLPFATTLLHELGKADTPAIGWVVYLGVFPTAIAFTTWAYALARTTAGRMGATTYLVPPLALLGGALCLVGVAVSRR